MYLLSIHYTLKWNRNFFFFVCTYNNIINNFNKFGYHTALNNNKRKANSALNIVFLKKLKCFHFDVC